MPQKSFGGGMKSSSVPRDVVSFSLLSTGLSMVETDEVLPMSSPLLWFNFIDDNDCFTSSELSSSPILSPDETGR